MQRIEHNLTHYYQPTNHTCGQASTAMVLSFLGRTDSLQDVINAVPVLAVGDVTEWGTLGPSLATWLLGQGFEVEMHTADFQLIDLEWARLPRPELLQRMRLARQMRNVPALGKELSGVALQAYLDFIEADGDFHIHPYLSTRLIDELLAKGPVLINVNPNVLHNYGRSDNVGLRVSIRNDLTGYIDTHFVVIYGSDGRENYLVADPWTGRLEVEAERLLCAMAAGQIQCENTIFQARSRN